MSASPVARDLDELVASLAHQVQPPIGDEELARAFEPRPASDETAGSDLRTTGLELWRVGGSTFTFTLPAADERR